MATSSCRARRAFWALLLLGCALAPTITPTAAEAQFFFRPYAYSYRQAVPDDEPAPFGSRRAVAGILAREGYRLVGPLGRRGEQVVATGVSRREGETRFIIDPYEGQILRAIRLGSAPLIDRPMRDDGEFVEPLGGSRPVVRDLGDEPRAAPRARHSRRQGPSTAAREAPPPAVAAPDQRGAVAPPAPGPAPGAPGAVAPAPGAATPGAHAPAANVPGAAGPNASGAQPPKAAPTPSATAPAAWTPPPPPSPSPTAVAPKAPAPPPAPAAAAAPPPQAAAPATSVQTAAPAPHGKKGRAENASAHRAIVPPSASPPQPTAAAPAAKPAETPAKPKVGG